MTIYYRVHCEFCSFTAVTDGADIDLTEYRLSNPQGSFVKDMVGNEEVVSNRKIVKRQKMVKCPRCGRGCTPKRMPSPPPEKPAAE